MAFSHHHDNIDASVQRNCFLFIENILKCISGYNHPQVAVDVTTVIPEEVEPQGTVGCAVHTDHDLPCVRLWLYIQGTEELSHNSEGFKSLYTQRYRQWVVCFLILFWFIMLLCVCWLCIHAIWCKSLTFLHVLGMVLCFPLCFIVYKHVFKNTIDKISLSLKEVDIIKPWWLQGNTAVCISVLIWFLMLKIAVVWISF